MEVLIESLAGCQEGAIERQESRGQADIVNSDQLPVMGTPGHPMYGRPQPKQDAAWAATGIVFEPAGEGALFRDVVLPEGWSKRGSDHAMWSYLLDDKGRERASIFYKAAFYDRRAHVRIEPRFSVRCGSDHEAELRWAELYDGGKKVFESKHISVPGMGWDEVGAADGEAKAEVIAWLKVRGVDGPIDDPAAWWGHDLG